MSMVAPAKSCGTAGPWAAAMATASSTPLKTAWVAMEPTSPRRQ